MSKKILIVEDEVDLVDALSYDLRSQGYEVICSYDGQEGFQKYVDEQPDLILLDINLPKLNGRAVCRQIRSNCNDHKTPVIIMLTGQTREVDRIIGKVQGANEYITKPFGREHLLEAIEKWLGK